MISRPGVAYLSSSHTTLSPELCYLPLEEVRIRALIVDVSARVILTQKYANHEDLVTQRCKYMFAVPASAAVCAFRMTSSDGRTIQGVCQEKQEAQEEYEQGLREGRFAGLLNYATDDIFTISIGAVPAHGTVEIHLEYVMTLANHENIDEIRFQLLHGIGERYGTPPTALDSAIEPTSYTRVKITCDIQTSGRIKEVSSPSHASQIKEYKYPVGGGKYSRRRTTIRLRSQDYLDRDFVLIVRASGLDTPRAFVEVQKDSEPGHHTLAIQLTLVPKNSIPFISDQEYLFVVDRSGSMGGCITIAKDTLLLLLRLLPIRGSSFNVFMFNNEVSAIWEGSREYGEATLREATSFVNAMDASGGTEITRALAFALQRRGRGVPTVVFVLTDGEVFDNQAIVLVGEAVKQSTKTSSLRVFTLGIGRVVSTAICDGIARAGNGTSLYAPDAESMVGKCARLLTAGRSPPVRNVSIDWGLPEDCFGMAAVRFSNQTLSPRTIATTLPPVIQQAPTEIGGIHAGTRMNVYVILTVKKVRVGQKIVLRGQLDDSDGTPFEMAIPVEEVRLAGADQGIPLIHTLSAWHLIQEHKEKRAPLPSALLPATEDELRRAVILRLGEKYQLVSEQTAFVAVDYGQNHRSHRARPVSPTLDGQTSALQPNQSLLHSALAFLSRFLGGRINAGLFGGQELPGSWPDSQAEEGVDDEGVDSDDSERTFSTLSSLDPGNWSDWSEPPSPQLTDEEERRQRSPSPKIETMNLGPNANVVANLPPLVTPPEAIMLVRLQSFDGSYQLDDSLRGIVGSKAVDEARGRDKLWATALAIAFIRRLVKETGQAELLNAFMEKPLQYLRSLAVDVEGILGEAENVFQ